MNGLEIRLSNESVIFNPEESLNKYLLNISHSDLIADVESFTGEEALSFPYRYTIRFTSTTNDAEAFQIVQKGATFTLRAVNPEWSKYFPDRDKWLALRKISGVITSISRVSNSADETLYEVVLEHPLALLDTSYRSAIYQNISVPELVKHILKEHGFEGYEINFDLLHWKYPSREMIVQWKETDLAFIQRLLSEVGIWFRFELHPDHDHIVVIIFGDSGAHYVRKYNIAAISPAGTTGNLYSLRKLTCRHAVVPACVHVRNYNYRESKQLITLEQRADLSRLPNLVSGKEYHYGDIHLDCGDRWSNVPEKPAETSWHYAKIRHENLLTNMITLEAVADDPTIVPGYNININGEKPAAWCTTTSALTMARFLCAPFRGLAGVASRKILPRQYLIFASAYFIKIAKSGMRLTASRFVCRVRNWMMPGIHRSLTFRGTTSTSWRMAQNCRRSLSSP